MNVAQLAHWGHPISPKSLGGFSPYSIHFRCSFCPRHRLRSSLRNAHTAQLWSSDHLARSSVKLSKCCTRAGLPPKVAALKLTKTAIERTIKVIATSPCHLQCVAAAGVIAFALLGLAPSVQAIRRNLFQRRDWDKSQTKHIVTCYVRPLILWAGILVICRGLDPVVLSSERSQAVKDRFVNFLRSISTVLTFAFCTARMTQQIQKVMLNRQSTEDSRNRGIRFIGSAVSTSVWVAAVCLFMELLGFSTQKWLTAGGFGTVLLTLAGREIFTNFLSSVMIHATRPFVEFEWIQTKIDGQEVSGTVEHVGWWSPTVIRGEDREAVHIPNHKFTMSVVRNLSQKTHWRIKTYIGLSHLDANKIHLIVADMRKVLSKHPQVEHRRLHRRVFFDNVDPVNQSLMIMVSCFVKTSHFEEYLSVKEIILLNLLKVISHHNARLATPIRSIQRVYDEVETRHSPFRNVSSEDAFGRPLLLVEASAVAADSGNNKSSSNSNVQQESAKAASLTNMQQENGSAAKAKPSAEQEAAVAKQAAPLEGLDTMGSKDKEMSPEKFPVGVSEADTLVSSEKDEGNGKVPAAKESSGAKKAQETRPPELKKTAGNKVKSETSSKPSPVVEAGAIKSKASQEPSDEGKLKKATNGKELVEKTPNSRDGSLEDDPWKDTTPPGEESFKKASGSSGLEENMVLGVALAGSKRTLPLDDDELGCTDRSESLSSSS